MTDIVDEVNQLSRHTSDAAAMWFYKWHSGDFNLNERKEYVRWLKTSPVHIAETLHVYTLHRCLRRLRPLQVANSADDSVIELGARRSERSLT